LKSKAKQKSRKTDQRQGIRQYCMMCSCNDFQEVRNCELTGCALYVFRTGDGKQDSHIRSKSIHDFCLWCKENSTDNIFGCDTKDCPLYSFRILDNKPGKWTRTL